EVRRELDTLERAADHLGQRIDRQRLGQSRHAFDQEVPTRQQRHQHPLEKAVLSHHDLFDLIEHLLHQGGVCVARFVHAGPLRQSGFSPTAPAAASIGSAKPMPAKVREPLGLTMAVTIPTTSPSASTSGPPELPGLAAASNWMRSLSGFLFSLTKAR